MFKRKERLARQKSRKRILPILLLVSFLIPLIASGCGAGKVASNTSKENPTIIAASFYPMYIMGKNIVGNVPGVEVVNMTRPITGCLHDYQLTTDDLRNLEKAKYFIVNGAGMESFLDKVTSQHPDLKIINASQGIEMIKDANGQDNPHIWVSVSLAIEEVQNIADQLAAADPVHGSAYRTNAALYIEKLQDLKDRMHQGLDGVKQKDIITFHEAFPYFAREFNLNIAAVIEHEPDTEPSAGELAQTVEMVRKTGVKAIFAEPQYSAKAAETIANETGVKISYLDPAVSGPDDANAYITIMDQNLAVLKQALGGQ
ncbi:MAG TPA: metal ABC transporter substrate-binding protein [Syntrophomonadaceae bacterium]|nr:metal ABC transporter substrate-binding protein [Syntrophomonadaceae bacterium]